MNDSMRFPKGPALDRILTLELVRVTERAAVAAARLRGRGDEVAADQVTLRPMLGSFDDQRDQLTIDRADLVTQITSLLDKDQTR